LGKYKRNIKTSAKYNLGYRKLKLNKPWFDDECSKLIGQWNQAKLQWLLNPSHINGDNLQNLRRETNRIFRNKKIEYLKGTINERSKGVNAGDVHGRMAAYPGQPKNKHW
jgi:hypothetical protein